MEEKIEAFMKLADVTTLVILINSPGGASVEGENLAALLLQRSPRGVKVLACMIQACSAAYQLASACQTIYCRRSAAVGCLGTHIYEVRKAVVTSGKRIIGNPTFESLAAILADLQTFADDTAEDLRDFVKARRGDRLKKEHYDSVMSGVTYIGVKAVGVGLADFIWEGTRAHNL